MNTEDPRRLRLELEDLLGDLWHARRNGNLGRLALVAYCEVRRWARRAGQAELAERSQALFTGTPYLDRDAFLAQMDALIVALENTRDGPPPPPPALRLAPRAAPARRA